jgi:hypothetical protein
MRFLDFQRLSARKATFRKKTGSDAALLCLPISPSRAIVHCNIAIGVAVLLPFLGVSSLNFGPLATAAYFYPFVQVAHDSSRRTGWQ